MTERQNGDECLDEVIGRATGERVRWGGVEPLRQLIAEFDRLFGDRWYWSAETEARARSTGEPPLNLPALAADDAARARELMETFLRLAVVLHDERRAVVRTRQQGSATKEAISGIEPYARLLLVALDPVRDHFGAGVFRNSGAKGARLVALQEARSNAVAAARETLRAELGRGTAREIARWTWWLRHDGVPRESNAAALEHGADLLRSIVARAQRNSARRAARRGVPAGGGPELVDVERVSRPTIVIDEAALAEETRSVTRCVLDGPPGHASHEGIRRLWNVHSSQKAAAVVLHLAGGPSPRTAARRPRAGDDNGRSGMAPRRGS